MRANNSAHIVNEYIFGAIELLQAAFQILGVVHAELNAILNANGRDLRGCKLYVALFPCNECAKAIIQSGIREIYYLSDKYATTPTTLASKRMLAAAGVKCTKLQTNVKTLTLDFVPPEEK